MRMAVAHGVTEDAERSLALLIGIIRDPDKYASALVELAQKRDEAQTLLTKAEELAATTSTEVKALAKRQAELQDEREATASAKRESDAKFQQERARLDDRQKELDEAAADLQSQKQAQKDQVARDRKANRDEAARLKALEEKLTAQGRELDERATALSQTEADAVALKADLEKRLANVAQAAQGGR